MVSTARWRCRNCGSRCQLRCWAAAAAALLLILSFPRHAAAQAGQHAGKDEESIMHQLRHAVLQYNPDWTAGSQGWHPNSSAHHCTWTDVKCDEHRRITGLAVGSKFHAPECGGDAQSAASLAGCANSPIDLPLSDLAHLQHLQDLEVKMSSTVLLHGLPAEWGLPSAFPQLQRLRLYLHGPSEGGQRLPDIHEGAFPRLQSLLLTSSNLEAALPPSWGSSADVLPQLETMVIIITLQGQLPSEWARGFRQLKRLSIRDAQPAQLPATIGTLPKEWAGGFPSLETLELEYLGLSASLPHAWQDSGFPQLTKLNLRHCHLTGTLPQQLFSSHPLLAQLSLEANHFSGRLPETWSPAKVQQLDLSRNNLTGPAFPASWLQAGALPALEMLDLSENSQMTGSLPTSLFWPKLKSLILSGTRLTGGIPEGWCSAPVKSNFENLMVDGTAVKRVLPPCATKFFPNLVLKLNSGSVRPSGDSPRRHTLLAALLPPAAVSALLILGAAGKLFWQRRVQRRTAQELLLDTQQLLPVSDSHGEARARPGATDGVDTWARQARLTELLTSMIRRKSSGSAAGASSIEMLPLEGMPPALVHKLGLARRQQTSSMHSMAASGGSDVRLSSAADVTRLLLSSTMPGDNHLSHELMSGQLFLRRWGLETRSLQCSPEELELVLDEQGQVVVLGAGSQAVVYLAMLYGMDIAVKVFELLPGAESGFIWREVALLCKCAHRRVVPLYGVAIKDQLLMLGIKLMRNGSLGEALQDRARQQELSWHSRGWQVAVDVAEALAYLHDDMRVVHNDLKSSNILLSEDYRAFIADLGHAQLLQGSMLRPPGFTRTHAAPEQLMGERCTLAVDLYSFGVLLIELTTQMLVVKRGSWRLPHAPQECSQGVLELIQDLIQADPLRRPTAAEALWRLQADCG